MRANEYLPESELLVDGTLQDIGNWFKSLVPTKDNELAGGAKEMERYVNGFILEMSRLAARYQDAQGKPITQATMNQLPTKALYLYMRKMKLADAEINRILKSLKKRLGPSINPVDVTAAQLADDDSTIQSIWGVNKGLVADQLLDKLISVAAVRKMEIEKLGDTAATEPAQQQQSQPQQAQQQPEPQSTPPAGATAQGMPTVADIDAALAAVSKL
jgi:hypothetical protein